MESTPLYCDFHCPHASFAPPDATGACRREQAVYCLLVRQYNNKNARCIAGASKNKKASGNSPKA